MAAVTQCGSENAEQNWRDAADDSLAVTRITNLIVSYLASIAVDSISGGKKTSVKLKYCLDR